MGKAALGRFFHFNVYRNMAERVLYMWESTEKIFYLILRGTYFKHPPVSMAFSFVL